MSAKFCGEISSISFNQLHTQSFYLTSQVKQGLAFWFFHRIQIYSPHPKQEPCQTGEWVFFFLGYFHENLPNKYFWSLCVNLLKDSPSAADALMVEIAKKQRNRWQINLYIFQSTPCLMRWNLPRSQHSFEPINMAGLN